MKTLEHNSKVGGPRPVHLVGHVVDRLLLLLDCWNRRRLGRRLCPRFSRHLFVGVALGVLGQVVRPDEFLEANFALIVAFSGVDAQVAGQLVRPVEPLQAAVKCAAERTDSVVGEDVGPEVRGRAVLLLAFCNVAHVDFLDAWALVEAGSAISALATFELCLLSVHVLLSASPQMKRSLRRVAGHRRSLELNTCRTGLKNILLRLEPIYHRRVAPVRVRLELVCSIDRDQSLKPSGSLESYQNVLDIKSRFIGWRRELIEGHWNLLLPANVEVSLSYMKRILRIWRVHVQVLLHLLVMMLHMLKLLLLLMVVMMLMLMLHMVLDHVVSVKPGMWRDLHLLNKLILI